MKKSDLTAIILSVIAIIISLIAIILSLAGCGVSKNLADMTTEFDVQTSITYIVWDGKQYEPFGIGAEHLMGGQIGVVNGDKNHRIYAIKGYDTQDWIIEKYHTGEMDIAMLYRWNVSSYFPEEFAQYKLLPDNRMEIAKRIIEDDGREIIVNSGCSWNFTLTEEKLIRITNKAAEYTGIDIDNDFTRYYGAAIDVWTYDTTPNSETYLFVFSGDELIYNIKFITAEHFEFVKNLCNEIV